jgi:phosphate transport system protein
MSVHLRRELEELKRKLVSFGTRVEEALAKSVRAVTRRDTELAQVVAGGDDELDRTELDIEEECLKVLALYQPVAADLRFVVAVLKMNNDLERAGDLAANIAKRAVQLADHPEVPIPFDFDPMARQALSMVKRALDALVNGDAALARQVCADDDMLDEMRRKAQNAILAEIRKAPERAELLIAVMSVYRHLERIGDMATNVAEDVVYMIEGAIFRHPAVRK